MDLALCLVMWVAVCMTLHHRVALICSAVFSFINNQARLMKEATLVVLQLVVGPSQSWVDQWSKISPLVCCAKGYVRLSGLTATRTAIGVFT